MSCMGGEGGKNTNKYYLWRGVCVCAVLDAGVG